MSSVFALVPYTAAFTPALLKYSEKIPKSMITNPTWVKIRNFSAAYRRVRPPPLPAQQKSRGRATPPKKPKKEEYAAMRRRDGAHPRNERQHSKARGGVLPTS